MPPRTRSHAGRWLLALGVTLLTILAMAILVPDLEMSQLVHRVALPIARIIAFVSLGLIVGEVIEATGWTRFLALMAQPLFTFARLGPRCSAAFTTAFVSGVAANSMLLTFYRNGQISKQQLFLSNFINHLPAFFLHLPTTVFIVLPLAGAAGGLYLLLVLTAVLLRTLLFALYGHFRLPAEQSSGEEHAPSRSQRTSISQVPQIIARKIPRRLGRIVQFVVPIYCLVFLLKVTGCFDGIQQVLADTAVSALIPIESLSMVILAFLADYTSGFATAGALFHSQMLSFQQVVLALLIANVIAAPIRTLRHQLPRYLGIFSPRMGTQILLLGQSFRIASLVLVGAGYTLIG